MFKTNVGGIDRALRILVGVTLVTLVFVGDKVGLPIGNWGWLGLIPITTGLTRTCPAYAPFGISTCRSR